MDPETDSDEEAPRPLTRQERRRIIRDKSRRERMFPKRYQGLRDPEATEDSKPPSAKKPIKKGRYKKPREISFEERRKHVAALIIRIANDLEELDDEERKWFEGGRDDLIDSLARKHQVVDKYRPVYSPTTTYEHEIIDSALTSCELEGDLVIEERLGWLRLHAQYPSISCGCRGHYRYRAVA